MRTGTYRVAGLSRGRKRPERERGAVNVLSRPLLSKIVFLLGAGILCLCFSPSSWASAGCPWRFPPKEEQPSGAGGWPSELKGAGSRSYSPFFFLWELSVLKTSFLRTIFFWVKGEKCSISSKWKVPGLPAPGTFPRSFLPLREEAARLQGGEAMRWVVKGRRGGKSEGKHRLLCSPGSSGPAARGLFVLAQAWRLERDRVWKCRANKRVGEPGSRSEWCPSAGGHQASTHGLLRQCGDKEDPTALPERNPATGRRGSVWL